MWEPTWEQMNALLGEGKPLEALFDQVRLVEAETGRVCAWQANGPAATEQHCCRLWNRSARCSDCAAQKACAAGQRMAKLDYSNEQYYLLIAQPLRWQGADYALELVTDLTDRLLTQDGLAQRESFVQDLSRQLEAVSEHEAFTGLYSKAYLEHEVQARLEQGGQPLYLAVFDIDNFRYINEFYGHVQGDAVLLKFTELLRAALAGTGGFAARFDGDEFAVVLPGGDLAAWNAWAEQVQRRFAEYLFRVAEMRFHASASVGVAGIGAGADFALALEETRARRAASGRK